MENERDSGRAEFRIGLISDTHGLLRREAVEQLKGSDQIIHAGDIGAHGIIESLQVVAPTKAIRGNVDTGGWTVGYPETLTLRIAGLSIHVLHDLADLSPAILGSGVDVVISGHSHRSRIEVRGRTLFLNPGSAGPRRFRLPVTIASLTIIHGRVSPQIHPLLP